MMGGRDSRRAVETSAHREIRPPILNFSRAGSFRRGMQFITMAAVAAVCIESGMPNRILIIADDRERVSGIPALLERMPDVELRIKRLTLGDYLVDHSVLIERKSAVDFSSSLLDGRLFGQAARLAACPDRPAVILQGTARDWADLGVRREALQGALVTLMLIFDIPVLRAADADEAARLILYTGRQLARLRDPNHAPWRQAKAKRKRTRQLRLLQTLPGVGGQRAATLLDHFGSIRACLEAPVEELQQIDGIGPKTAEAIRETLREDAIKYESRFDGGDLLLP